VLPERDADSSPPSSAEV